MKPCEGEHATNPGVFGDGDTAPRGGLSSPRGGPPGPLFLTLQVRCVGGAPAWAGASFRFPRSPPDFGLPPTSRWAWCRAPGAPAKPQGCSPQDGSASHSASRQRSPWALQCSSAPGPLKPQGFSLSARVARHAQVDDTNSAARRETRSTVVKGFSASGAGTTSPMSRFPALRHGLRTQPVLHHSPSLLRQPASTGGTANRRNASPGAGDFALFGRGTADLVSRFPASAAGASHTAGGPSTTPASCDIARRV
jgi:hypothetical protein